MDDLTGYRRAACEAARRAAAVLQEWRGKFQVREKGRADLLTDADLASQRTIQAFLHERFPSHAFLGEEGGGPKGRPGPGAPPTWIVDPIDGTTNYAHDCPLYCISIGLEIDGELVAGAILDPRHDELYEAARGQGAFLNGKPLRTSQVSSLDQALVATGFPPDLTSGQQALEWWRYFSFRTQSLRRTGSTAINLAWLAAGRFDAFYAFDNHVWDVAAGVVIVREAGGTLTRASGEALDPYEADMLATNGHLHPALVEALRTGP